MKKIKQQICEWLDLEQNSLNEISLEDIEFAEIEEQSINDEVSQLLSVADSRIAPTGSDPIQQDGVPCRSYWIEDTKELVLYLWSGDQSKAIIVPQGGWTIREDITIH
jgi:hypothetical protein